MTEKSTISFNINFLEENAVKLAANHNALENGGSCTPVKPILEESKKVMEESYRVLSRVAKSDQEISSAAEWLIDNFYIIKEHIVQVGVDFPKEYQKRIPLFKSGDYKGLPKVYELVLNLMTHTDNMVDIDVMTQYVQSYQEVRTLTMGEIWAIPIMARLILIQKLAKKTTRVLYRRNIRSGVQELIKKIEKKEPGAPGEITNLISVWLKEHSDKSGDQLKLIELFNQLQSSGLLLDEQKRWFNYRFRQNDLSFEEAMNVEAQKQSRLQVSIQHAINSLRYIDETDWSDFAEECSKIDQILRQDPMGYYSEMDSQTRDNYRKTVERVSRRSDFSETEVAEQVLSMAEAEVDNTFDDLSEVLHNHNIIKQHVGYYLRDEGYKELVKKTSYKMPIKEKIIRVLEKRTGYYLSAIAFLALILLAIIWVATGGITASAGLSVSVLLVAFYPVLDLSVSAVNRFFAFFLSPRILPKMDYDEGIPEESRTMVVVPTMFSSPQDVREQVEALEIRSLANSNSGLQFALLSDFTDAEEKNVEGDKAIVDAATEAIKDLNEKYSSKYGNKFYLLHRERQWNESEQAWMGWERKRGKIEEFNRMICEPSKKTSYATVTGDFRKSIKLQEVQFIITLDSDTKLPPDSAKNLVRTIAHPLNRARYDHDKTRITKGYGIVQPRISIQPESARKTFFSRIFSGNVGIDPYSTAVSDIYQDLAGEAVYTGKGIYDIQAFHTVLSNRFPENRILSHDLIESTYLRTGLATDIELFDEFPSTYASFSKRNHRWTRGDWQIAAWLFKDVPAQKGKERNPINLLSKWKIFDNLRRSMNPFFLTLFFVAGWFWLPGSAWIWTAGAFGILAFPIYVSLSSDMLNRPARVRWKLYFSKVKANLKINSMQAVFTVMILPHQAVVYLDAIFRTLYRISWSNKSLLEWTTASKTESASPNSVMTYFRNMLFPVLLGLTILAFSFMAPHYLWIMIPFFLLWSGSPIYVWYASQPVKVQQVPFSDDEKLKLRTYARRTWFYFERFVNEDHSWLPPDNYQENPPSKPVNRTSPTNIGLALVSVTVAYNMGYITYGEMLERLQKTLRSIGKLERHKGHFYNWYETKQGDVLSPRYISTVDSGNLAASLIVVKEAVKQGMKSRGINENLCSGIQDTLLTLREIFESYDKKDALPQKSYESITQCVSSMMDKLSNLNDSDNLERLTLSLLKSLKDDAAKLSSVNLLPMGSRLGDQEMRDLYFWLESPLKQIENAILEYKCITSSKDIDLSKFSPNELYEMNKTEKGDQPCFQLLKQWKSQAEYIIKVCERITDEMDFSFLYLKKRGLFSIGYNEENAQLDKGTYDLLASEARIASYVAISKGDIPVEHWFRLSRRLTSLNQKETLLSWSGTMFEYLMPLLFMRSYPETLMSHTYHNVIEWQKEYGKQRKQPWGISESAYNFLNIDMHYQYRAFGAPGLGLKRGLAEEYVVAPYASMLALMVKPKISLENLEEIEQLGGLGLYGFYDALDFTPSHLSDKVPFKVVKTYMAHHHGMSLIAIENLLNEGSINDYFHSDAMVRGSELLLQEKVPMGIPIKEPHPIDVELEPGEKEAVQKIVEPSGMDELDISPPRLHILSNKSYSTFVTHAGTGSSKCRSVALNSWDPDPTVDPSGMFFYIKDLETDKYWSAMHQPVKSKPDRYDTWFHNGKIVTSRVDNWIETTTEICVSPDHEIEFRKIILTNYSEKVRKLELTSYAEVVLNRLEDHRSHPAFSKLFVQTDYLAEHNSLIAKRRPRSDDEKPVWLIHTFAGHNQDNGSETLQFETERSNFIGRGRSLSNPVALDKGYKLKGSLGNVSDPIVSLRETIELKPGEKIQFTFGLGMAHSKEEAIHLAGIYDNQHATNRVFDLATVYSTVELNHLDITPKQAHYYQKLASYALYSNLKFRGSDKRLKENRKKQQDLWAYGISGDLPLFVFIINDTDQLKRVKTMLKAHAFWRLKGLETELLILNDHPPSYSDEVQEAIHQSIETSMDRERLNKRGGVFVQKTDKLPEKDLTLILTVAHAVFEEELPKLFKTKQSSKTTSWYHENEPDKYQTPALDDIQDDTLSSDMDQNLQLFNGYGGFTPDGDEYHILIHPDPESGKHIFPPAPWINVISNPNFGFTATEKGAGYTWSENSRENKLTGWSNDPVKDPHSEAFYIRDEEKKIYWSPTPGPVPGAGKYKVAHGFGYTRYEYSNDELEQELLQFVPRKESVKISKLTLTNNSNTKRKISVFRYLDRVLGVDRNRSSRFVIPEVVDEGKTLFHVNHYNNEFAGRTVFAAVRGIPSEAEWNFTTSRASFIGRNRSLKKPAALSRSESLDNGTVIGEDPCAAFQATFNVDPGESKTIYYLEGEGLDRESAEEIIFKLSDPEAIEAEFQAVKESWKHKLNRIEVTTPNKPMDLMLNGWLMYQNMSSRMWARTAFYQAGGAFGFRDQLQDSMASMYIDPELTKTQLLLHASNQFREGDVLHWWHPPTGRGIRSRITDDRLWLPYVTNFYIESTGDESILKEESPYITARKLEDYEHEEYLHPEILDEKGTLYEHCCKAIDVSLKFGTHGLPLIGGGDWNDGMNRVGEGGKGESVWLGFFMYLILIKFERICTLMGDKERAERYKSIASTLKGHLNEEGWDEDWYIRAFFDDGTPLGSSENVECKIDAISQAWSVISGAATEERGEKALKAVEKHLISEEDQIIKLLTPAFDKTEKNPGYIKGYIPGVRENGGQYTHGALWVVKAFADMGHGAKALNYFNMINPVNHALNKEDVDKYKVEPYVVAADVYGEEPLIGMGGWTWYTGSGGWMYRVALESILGFRLTEEGFLLEPTISPDWNQYEIKYRLDDDKTVYNIRIQNQNGLESGNLEGTVDGEKVKFEEGATRIQVKKDGKVHEVKLRIVSD